MDFSRSYPNGTKVTWKGTRADDLIIEFEDAGVKTSRTFSPAEAIDLALWIIKGAGTNFSITND